MTRRRRRSRFSDGGGRRARAAAPALALALALAALAAAVALPRKAAAQACCVGTGLVTPARLRTFEDRALGIQMRARSVMGAFGGTGSYATSTSGTSELGFEEDLFGALRLGSRFQVGVWAPFVQTARQAGGLSGWGGGLGDVAANARFDAVDAGTRGYWPGVAILSALSVPTGRPLDGGDDPLATSGTGSGSFEGSLGLAVEEIVGSGFVSLAGWVSQRSSRTVAGVEQSFAPRLSALLAGGYTFGHDVTVGAFASWLRQGDARDAGTAIANSSIALVTAGGALALPFWQSWRLQATLFTDLPLAGWGRNQTVGYGGTVAIIRFWI
jgi:hypothetical protein